MRAVVLAFAGLVAGAAAFGGPSPLSKIPIPVHVMPVYVDPCARHPRAWVIYFFCQSRPCVLLHIELWCMIAGRTRGERNITGHQSIQKRLL